MTLSEATTQAEAAAAEWARLQRELLGAGEKLSEALSQLLAVMAVEKAQA